MEYLQEIDSIIIDNRASAVLYRYLDTQDVRFPFVLPINICPIVNNVIKAIGYPIIYIDISNKTFCIDENILLETLASQPCAGVLLNHSYGADIDFSNLVNEIKSKHNILIVEDKCLCFPDLTANKDVDLTLYSTGYSKLVELEYGGGIGILNGGGKNLNTRNQKIILDYETELVINKFDKTFDEYIADIDNIGEKIVSHKQGLNNIYYQYLSPKSLDKTYNNWRFNFLVENKNLIMDEIFHAGLFASSHYKPLINDSEEFPNASYLYEHVINLFNDFHFSKDQAEKISQLILSMI